MTAAANAALSAADADRAGFAAHVKYMGWCSDWEYDDVVDDITASGGTVPLTEDVVSIPAKGPFPENPSELPTIPLKNGIPGLVPPGTHVFKPHDTLVKISRKNGDPNTVQTFDWDSQQWGRSMSVRAGQGKELLDTVTALHPRDRKVPEQTAATYGHATGSCLMCGIALSGRASLSRGYGPRCASKVK